MKKPKSSLVRNLLLNLKMAQFSNENPEIEVDKIMNSNLRMRYLDENLLVIWQSLVC
jgi:hypothetical protein